MFGLSGIEINQQSGVTHEQLKGPNGSLQGSDGSLPPPFPAFAADFASERGTCRRAEECAPSSERHVHTGMARSPWITTPPSESPYTHVVCGKQNVAQLKRPFLRSDSVRLGTVPSLSVFPPFQHILQRAATQITRLIKTLTGAKHHTSTRWRQS